MRPLPVLAPIVGRPAFASTPPTESPGQPGFGVAVAALALLAAALLAGRRTGE